MSIKIPCPTCHGKKTMNDPSCIGKFVGYCDPHGNTIPQVTCITCEGVGHVIKRETPYTVDDKAIKESIRQARKARQKPKAPSPPSPPPLSGMTLQGLIDLLEKALHAEDYEQCALIRDEMRKRGR